MRRKRAVRELVEGDLVAMEPDGIARIRRAIPAPGKMALPFRKTATRAPVPAWTVTWKKGDRLGQAYLDPDDEVWLAG